MECQVLEKLKEEVSVNGLCSLVRFKSDNEQNFERSKKSLT